MNSWSNWLKVLGLALAVLLLSFSVVRVRAQGELEMAISGDEVVLGDEADMEATVVESSYYLPYPGVLPDHPLYFLKMVRDRVVEWLTFSPESRAELYVFYADKRFGAGMVLSDGGKTDLGLGAYQKSVRYQAKAITELEKLKSSGKDVGALANKIEQESTKFMQVIDKQSVENEQLRNSVGETKKEMESNREKVLKLLDREK